MVGGVGYGMVWYGMVGYGMIRYTHTVTDIFSKSCIPNTGGCGILQTYRNKIVEGTEEKEVL